MQIAGTTTLVTGAASGLGRELALQLAQRGCTVWLADRNGDALDGVAAEVTTAGGTPHTLVLDVTDDEGWVAARARVGRVDLLVNNAGVADVGPLVGSTDAAWDRQLNINVMGVVRGCRQFVPAMVDARRGHVVNIASFAGVALAPGMIAYNTAKAAVVAFSESLRVEVALDGVGVTVCCPAFFRTNLTDSMDDASPDMVRRVQRWMDTSGVTATDVASATLRAVERNEMMVLTHSLTRRYHWMKRLAPERYRRMLLQQEAKRRARSSS